MAGSIPLTFVRSSKNLRIRSGILTALLSLVFVPLQAQQADSLWSEGTERLDSVVLSARRPAVELLPLPGLSAKVPASAIRKVPSVLGLSDPLRFVFLLPSVQTGSDVDNGIHIQGCENAHNYVSMGGAPIYGAGHMLGFASVFNAGHFREMSYSTVARDYNRLGGVVDMSLPDAPLAAPSLELSAGLFLTQATIRVPAGKHTFVLSGRHSYFNLLYSNYLEFNDAPLRYDFGDANLTWTFRPGDRDVISANGYFGRDAAEYNAEDWQIKSWANWRNAVGSLSWRHEGAGWTTDHLLYGTLYRLKDDVRMDVIQVSAPSEIRTLGYRGRFHLGGFELLAETAQHYARPLQPTDRISIEQYGWESTLQAKYTLRKGPFFVGAWLRGTWYLSPEKDNYYSLDPRFEAAWTGQSAGTLAFKTGVAHQYLFQTGPSDSGFPTEYWILAGALSAPQSSRYVSLSWSSDALLPKGWNLSCEGYYRDLRNQLEYSGYILEYANPNFSLEDYFIHDKGYNFGLNLSLQKTEGRLTGWIAYAFGRALRHSEDPGTAASRAYCIDGWYPARHERIHECKLVGTYDFGDWDLGVTVIAASGRPWTQPLAFYLLGGKILTVYDDYNGGRLKPFFRTDLSANWYLHKDTSRREGFNLSLYNAIAYPNELGRMIKMDDEGRYYYGSILLQLRILPSIGYFLQF